MSRYFLPGDRKTSKGLPFFFDTPPTPSQEDLLGEQVGRPPDKEQGVPHRDASPHLHGGLLAFQGHPRGPCQPRTLTSCRLGPATPMFILFVRLSHMLPEGGDPTTTFVPGGVLTPAGCDMLE